MDWRSHFKSTFFSAWRDEGLPDPVPFHARYQRALSAFEPSLDLASVPVANATALSPEILGEVYRFGAFYGDAVGRLLTIPEAEIEGRINWCARFNLGISLFDYLSDEMGRCRALLDLAPFRRLASVDSTPVDEPPTEPASEEERFL